MEKPDPIEAARQWNRIEMDKRVAAAAVELRERYPMRPDNICLSMTEAQFLAYIRERREVFDQSHARA